MGNTTSAATAPSSTASAARAAACALRVFSHRGRGLGATSSLLRAADITALSDRGITHFDLDLSWTSDGMVLVSHPGDVSTVLSLNVFNTSAAALTARAAALGPAAPLWAAQLLRLASDREEVTFALDLKDSERSADRPDGAHRRHLQWLAEQVLTRGLSARVWLWVETAAAARSLRRALGATLPFSALRLIRPVRDRDVRVPSAPPSSSAAAAAPLDCTATQVAREDAKVFRMLGPSLRCANGALLAAPFAAERWGDGPDGARLLVWVVDRPRAELPPLLRLGVRHVISNEPLRVAAAARAFCRDASLKRYSWVF